MSDLTPKRKYKIRKIPTDKIDGGKIEEESTESDVITASVGKYGIISPITVCELDGRYRIIEGRKRLFAAEELGIRKITAVIFKGSEDDIASFAAAIKIAKQKEDTEKARIIREYSKYCGKSGTEAAESLGISSERAKELLELTPGKKTVRYLELPLEKGYHPNVKMAFGSYRIFGNTIENTVNKIRECGVDAKSDIHEDDSKIEYVIQLMK